MFTDMRITGNTGKAIRIVKSLVVTSMIASLLASATLVTTGGARADGLETVNVHMSFQGAAPVPPTATLAAQEGRPVEIMLSQDGAILKAYKDTLSTDGSLKLDMTGLKDGMYQVWAKSPRFLAAQVDVKYSA